MAPFLLHRLGLAIPDDMAGRVPAEVLVPAERARRPPRFTTAAPPLEDTSEPADVALDPEEQAGVLQRLRALGYVE